MEDGDALMLGLVTKRRLMREIVDQGQAYREAIAEANLARHRAERELREFVRLLGEPRGVKHERDRVVVVLEFTNVLVASGAPDDLRRYVMESVLERLAQITSRDYRGDLRETEEDRRRRLVLG